MQASEVKAGSFRWISSTETQRWQEMPVPALVAATGNGPAQVKIDVAKQYQQILGFGGCFNELAWQALQGVGELQRDEALKALFGPDGCNFSVCRQGIGANDFALHWYSLDEMPDDFAMTYFNVDEDEKTLIPYIKAAMRYQPKLAIWGVPWCPPAWMKTNGRYQGGGMNQDPRILAAYALYFSRYVQAYREEGINIRAVMPQNEPCYNNNVYPQCKWSAQELNTFIRDHLVPQLKKDKVDVEVWLGTLPKGDIAEYVDPVLGDAATNASIVGVGGQYGGQMLFMPVHEKYPDKKLLQTEAECYDGDNKWEEGMATFGHIIDDTLHFANGYMFWNMILSEKGSSSWGWRQNCLITLDTQAGKVIYNPEFYAMKHAGHLVQPGALRIDVAGGPFKKMVGFKNPSGEIVLLFSNEAKESIHAEIRVGNSIAPINVPASSMNSIVLAE